MQIPLPSKPKIIKSDGNRAIFEIEGCYPGYGITLGNALRRALLSSLPGAAITGIKIKGVQHEFSTIPYILEDVIEIILNLKQIRFKLYSETPVKIFLKVKGEKEVKAEDIKTTAEVEIINKEVHIATLTDKKAELEIELEVSPGLGYQSSDVGKKGKLEIGQIAIDAIFTPIKKVNFEVENMRVGERTDYNRLKLDIETDGSISPIEALEQATQILVSHFKTLSVLEKPAQIKKLKKSEKILQVPSAEPETVAKEMMGATKIKVEELKLSNRTLNALLSAGIKTVSGLNRKKEEDLKEIKGMGAKGIKEIKRALGKLGLILKQ